MTPSERKAFVELMRRWRERPDFMVRELFHVVPDPWQDEALRAFPATPRLAMKACKGVGKTTELAWLCWNFLLTRQNSNIQAISITGSNLSDGLWKEMAKWRDKAPLLQELFTWNKTRIESKQFPSNWFMTAKSYSKTASREEQGRTLSGFHADYVMTVIDESGGMMDAVMNAAEGTFAGSVECHIVQAGNPSQRSGPLYRACTTSRDLWRVVTITGDPDDPSRSARVPVEHARAQIAQYGRNDPWVKTDIFGEFPDSDIDSLISQEDVEAAMKRFYRENEIGRVPKVLGVDVARFGNDSSSLCKRQGIQMFPFANRRGIDSMQGASWVNREWLEWGADACFIDGTGGFGSGWEDQLRVLGKTAIPVHFSSQASEKTKFYNKRAEMAFEFVRWIKRGGAMPYNKGLMDALTQSTYTFQGDRMLLEPKELLKAKIGFSPDDFDAAILTFAEPVTIAAQQTRRANKLLVDYDPFEEFSKPAGSYADTY